jgi:hypothetical protein
MLFPRWNPHILVIDHARSITRLHSPTHFTILCFPNLRIWQGLMRTTPVETHDNQLLLLIHHFFVSVANRFIPLLDTDINVVYAHILPYTRTMFFGLFYSIPFCGCWLVGSFGFGLFVHIYECASVQQLYCTVQ